MRNRNIYLFFFGTLFFITFKSCQTEEQIAYARYFVAGRDLYIQHCQNCHSDKGEGLGDLIPPLTDTSYLLKNRNSIACFIKFGLNDSIVINGKTYSEQMPPEPNLTSMEIAQLVTYVTNSFGNKQGLYDVEQATSHLKACVGRK